MAGPCAPALLLLLPALAAGSCSSPPGADPPPPGLRRSTSVLWDRYLSPAAAARDVQQIVGSTRAIPGELARLEHAKSSVSTLGARGIGRADHIVEGLTEVAGAELQRPGEMVAGLPTVLEPLAGDIPAAGSLVPTVLGLDRRLMPERDDREHRIDPDDDRPEATVWQRLRRRLRL